MKRKGFTLIELLVVVAIIALLISILLPSLARARELSKRAVCAANVRGIGQSAKIYANDFNERWPVAPYYKHVDDYAGIGVIADPDYRGPFPPGTIPRIPQDPSISRCFWLLVKQGGTTAKQFVCPSSGDSSDDIPNPMTYYDFFSVDNVSYGYQYPYTMSGGGVGNPATPSEARDPGMAMIADGNEKTVFNSNPWGTSTNFYNKDSYPGEFWKADMWKQVNSENHSDGEGQNVLFQDGHASFEPRAACGLPVGTFPLTNTDGYNHPDLIYENLDGIYGGVEVGNDASIGMPIDPNDSVIVHQGENNVDKD